MARRDDSATQQQAQIPTDNAEDSGRRNKPKPQQSQSEDPPPAAKKPGTTFTDWASI